MRNQTRRLPVIVILVAASLLLAVPGVAGAHVKAQYRNEYKRQLTSFDRAFTVFGNNYDSMTADSTNRAEIMAPMVDEPSQRETLLQHENDALAIYNACKDLPAQWSITFGKSISAFKGKAKRYFSTANQQRLFTKRCDLVKSYASYLMWLANDHGYDSYRLLGTDPPAFEASAQAIADGDADAATGHDGWDKWLAALRALQ